MKNRKKQSLKFIIVLAIMFIGIGYAYLTTTLSINGTTDIDSNSWNIYWDNIQVVDGSVTGDQITQAPVIDSSLTSVSFHVNLKTPGEYYEFTVDAVNSGTIDAMINTITKTSNIPNYLNFNVTYSTGISIAVKQKLKANSTETYKVRVEYRTDIDPSDLPSTQQSLDLEFSVEYVQADDNAVALPDSMFTLSCSNDTFYFTNNMTVSDWLQSDFYPGDVDGMYDTLEQCISVWGNNKGCSNKELIRYYYRDPKSYYEYTDSLEECNKGLYCTTLYNTVYKCEVAENFYDTYEECKAAFESGECDLVNGKYAAFHWYNYNTYQTDSGEYTSCSLLPVGYQYNDYYDYSQNSLEECLENHPSESELCITKTYNYYGPDQKTGSVSEFYIYKNHITYYGNSGNRNNEYQFNYNDIIESKEYECYHGAECVSPESDILSGNSKTFKAKNIKENDLIVYYNFDTNRTEIGRVSKVYIHKNATNLIRYEFEDNTYLEATDYHPIYTKEGWKSYTNRNGYPKPVIGDLVKTNTGYKRITKIVPYIGNEDYYDFKIISRDGKLVDNYFANGTLVQGSY